MLDTILDLALASIQLDHREANTSVVKFVSELLDTKTSRENVNELLKMKLGQRLVEAIINATLFHLPSYFVPDMSDLMWQLMSFNRDVSLFLHLFIITKLLNFDNKITSSPSWSESGWLLL